jgi:2-polyprenyl-6-methoxyphenol hydroxylase-like FAD-dependent oxidoreductase
MAGVVIVGGGIAGLTAALALQRHGIEARVYEAAPELRAVGAGIWMPPNAMAVLAQLGLADAVQSAGMPLQRVEVCDFEAGVLSSMELADMERRLGHTIVAIRRSELQRILAGALQPGTLHLDHAYAAHSVAGDVVTAVFRGGGSASGALLIGADGLHSTVRHGLFPSAPLRYSGQTCYRGLASLVPDAGVQHVGREIWGGAHRFGFSAVGPDTVYWFAPISAPAGQAPPPELKAALLRDYASFPAPVLQILEATDERAILQTDLYDLRPMPRWSSGRVGLVGDAAHATTPNLGQGGAQAMEDALALALRVRDHGAMPAALDALERARRGRAVRIVNMSWTFARVSHWTHPLARRIRNGVMKSVPAAVERHQVVGLFTPVL